MGKILDGVKFKISQQYNMLFFFYKNLIDVELIKKINETFEIEDGQTMVDKYDVENNVLTINSNPIYNNVILYGKIVNFDMSLGDVIQKINEIKDIKRSNKPTYTLDTIVVNKNCGGICQAYIIH